MRVWIKEAQEIQKLRMSQYQEYVRRCGEVEPNAARLESHEEHRARAVRLEIMECIRSLLLRE